MRVLLVDDDAAVASGASSLCSRSKKLIPTERTFGEEGVDLGKIYDYDIILLDLNLPGYIGI